MSDTTGPDRDGLPPEAEIATIRSDPNRWHYGDRVAVEDAVLLTRGAAKSYWLYDELERDPQVGCELAKRKMALVGREWSVTAGAEDALAGRARDLVERALRGCRLNQAVEKLLDALLKGFSVAEVMWVRRAGPAGPELVPAELRGRDQRRFVFRLVPADAAAPPPDQPPAVAELRLLTRADIFDGIAVPGRKFVVHRFGAKHEQPYGLGLGARLFWPVFFKRQGVGFWLSALEKFGQPTGLGRYPAGSSIEDQDKLLAALGAIASEAGVIVPEGMSVELIEAKRAGSFDSYERLARYMDEDISKVILGQTLTTSAGQAGSRALGQVHDGVRLELTRADADLLSDTLNSSLVRWIVDLNLPGYEASGLPYPTVWWDVAEPEDLDARAERDERVFRLGYRPTEDYIRDTYGEGWMPAAGGAAPAADGIAAAFAEAGRAARRRMGGAVPEVELAEQLDAAARPHTDAWLDRIARVVAGAATLEEVAAELLRLYPELETGGLAEVMAQALAVANLTGRAEIADGIA